MDDDRKFEDKIRQLLLDKFGSSLVTLYMDMIKKQLHLPDLNACNEYEQRRVLTFVVDKLFGKVLKKEDLKKQRYIIFYQFFGEKKALEFLGSNEYTIQPITFVYYIFGDALGDKIISIGQELYEDFDIKRKDELQQILFVKRLIIDVFGLFGETHVRELNLRFFMFLKFGEDPNQSVLRYLLSKGRNNSEMVLKIFDSLFSFFGRLSETRPEQILDNDLKVVMNRMGIDAKDQAAWLDTIHKEMQKIKEGKINAELASGGKHSIAEVKRVLSYLIGFADAEETVSQASEVTGVKGFKDVELRKKTIVL